MNHKKEVRKTGGGRCPKPLSDATERVSSIVPAQLISLENDFDCDEAADTEKSTVFNTNDEQIAEVKTTEFCSTTTNKCNCL